MTQEANISEASVETLVLTDAEVASLLRVSLDTVKNLHRTKQMRGIKIGRHLRWPIASVQEFIEELRRGQG